jgi:thiol-disulfide isomerase/thioredoxin
VRKLLHIKVGVSALPFFAYPRIIVMLKRLLQICLFLAYCVAANAVEEGQPAPACPAQLQDQPAGFAPEAYKGKVVLVDFWASWCGPCLKSMPFFNQLQHVHHEMHKDNFEIVAINVDDEKETAQTFLQDHPVTYPVAYNPSGECPKSYGVKAMPSSYLIDKTGKVRHVHLGYRDGDQEQLQQLIAGLLAE